MPSALADLYADLDTNKLRFRRPFRSIFLCGGLIGPDGERRVLSLRDYLYRRRSIDVGGKIVLAESANQLFRDTGYHDLISFEEDIARIASIVLVISESPGSLAELGAFAMNDTIRRSLRLIVQSKYSAAESFIRFGPIEKVANEHPEAVGFYPWEVRPGGQLIIKTADKHYPEIKRFIRSNLKDVHDAVQISLYPDLRTFYVIYWVLYLSFASSLTVLHYRVREILPTTTISDLRDKLYCLKLLGWVGRESYSGKEYYFTLGGEDPLSYHYRVGVKDRDNARRKLRLLAEFEKSERLPKHIREVVVSSRRAAR